ncbi:MAG: ATP-dependent helicase RecG [Actinomycetota bacterium]|nr:ATP-dependent helicase RecG [Actinomycetota bacterium]
MARVKTVNSRWTNPRGGAARGRRTNVVEVVVTDGTGELTVTFFNQAFRQGQLRPGRRGLFAGKVGSFRGRRQLSHPGFVLLPEADEPSDPEAAATFSNTVIPVYPSTSGMPSWRIQAAMALVLPYAETVADPIPAEVRSRHALLELSTALHDVHRPADMAAAEAARDRLRWQEAFLLQGVLLRRRSAARALTAVPRLEKPEGLVAALDAALPFELTPGQSLVAEEIRADLAQGHPMMRLLQGEVGSGKTVVALRAMLSVVDAGAQAALLAPTEVLAGQHYRGILDLLGPMAAAGTLQGADGATGVVLLTGSQTAAERRQALTDIASGQAGIVVGTHALISEGVDFHDLGLVVIDEQHRFGVEQRALLLDKARTDTRPHLLVMTATPIPRTVAMTVFGDLDVSTLRELPAGRSPIATHVVPAAERPDYLSRTWLRVREEVEAGHQVYVVCPRIEEGEQSEARPPGYPPAAVVELVGYLASGPLAGVRLGLLHGRLRPAAKDAVMAAFADPTSSAEPVEVLVATTVIEVGVDVPNATTMVIVDAERFGVSALHQLRGRVGRGSAPGLCLLVTTAAQGSPARERLQAVAATTDGFELSLVDLRVRREGDVLGANQSGRSNSLRLLSVLEDEEIIARARDEFAAVLETDPTLRRQPALMAALTATEAADDVDYLEKT